MNATETFNLWSQGWARFMGHGLIESTVLFALVGGLWLLLRNRRWVSAQLGYGLFLLVLLKLVIPAQFSIPEVISSLFPRVPISVTEELLESYTFELLRFGGLSEEASSAAVIPNRAIEVQPQFAVTLPTVLMLGWAAIVLAFLIRFCWVEWRTRRMFRDTTPLDSQQIRIDTQNLQRIAGVKQPIRWVTGSWVKSPMTFGLFRPIVAVPPGISEEYTSSQIRWILLHELAHIKRRDALVSSFQRILQILFFFHPIVWLSNWTIDQLREFACDDIALSNSETARKDCGEVFLSVVAQANGLPTVIPATLGIINYKTTIRRRLMRILDSKRHLQARLSVREIVFLALAFLIALPFATVATGDEKQVDGTTAPKSLTVNTYEDLVTLLEGTLESLEPIVCVYTVSRERTPDKELGFRSIAITGHHGRKRLYEELQEYGFEKHRRQNAEFTHFGLISDGQTTKGYNCIQGTFDLEAKVSNRFSTHYTIERFYRRLVGEEILRYLGAKDHFDQFESGLLSDDLYFVRLYGSKVGARFYIEFDLKHGGLPRLIKTDMQNLEREWRSAPTYKVTEWMTLKPGVHFPKHGTIDNTTADNETVHVDVVSVYLTDVVASTCDGFQYPPGMQYLDKQTKQLMTVSEQVPSGSSTGLSGFTLFQDVVGIPPVDARKQLAKIAW